LTYKDVVDFVGACLNEGKSLNETVELLVKKSLDRGSLDNITAIVVLLKDRPNNNANNQLKGGKPQE
jgi:serine/threonine protein phosphatase PrpC